MPSKLFILLLGAALSSACGKSDGNAAAIPQGEFPTKAANLLCDSLANCCHSSGFAVDVDGCKQEYVTRLSTTLSKLDPQKVQYDAQAAGDCLAAVQSVIRCGDVEGPDAPVCDEVLRGQVQLGQPCSGSDECQQQTGKPRARCTSEDDVAPPVCTSESRTAWQRGTMGEACSRTCLEDDCDGSSAPLQNPGTGEAPLPQTSVACYRSDGLYCDQGTCARTLGVGLACQDDAACSGNVFCDFNTQACVAPRAEGEPCDADSHCQSNECRDAPPSVDGMLMPQFCVSSSSVSAAQCGNDFDAETPATEPGPSTNPPPTE